MRLTQITMPLALAAATTLALSAPAMARDNVQIAGSSTVLPFASVAAEEFGRNFPQFKTPVVGSGGTGGGFRQFCQGTGATTIDISNASRKIGPAEIASCKKAGVNKIHEIMFGYDGIVFASDAKGQAYDQVEETRDNKEFAIITFRFNRHGQWPRQIVGLRGDERA